MPSIGSNNIVSSAACLGLLVVALGASPCAVHAQYSASIVDLYGSRNLGVGEYENFRVRVRPGASWPINYLWDMGDGTYAVGNNVWHKYDYPGRYRITTTVSNRHGADTISVVVEVGSKVVERSDIMSVSGGAADVEPVEESATPRRSRRSFGIEELQGRDPVNSRADGYTWVVRTFLEFNSAESHARRLRLDGYRTGVVVDRSGNGSTAYRVVVGQFRSEDSALSATRHVKRLSQSAWLVRLPV